jgi:hypothetical protein
MGCTMAKNFIQKAVQRPGRIREALGLKEGEKVTNEALDRLHARLMKSGKMDKSMGAAIGLARRFISKGGV